MERTYGMELIDKLLVEDWQHTAGDDRVEVLMAHNADLQPCLQNIADALMSDNGHATAFAEIVDQVARMKADPQRATPMPFGYLTDDGMQSLLALRFISEKGLSEELADRLEAAPDSDAHFDEASPSP